jgi:hypothetical protein
MKGQGTTMAVSKKQGVYWIDYYVNGQRKRERIGPDKCLAETVLKKRKVEIAEEKFLDRQRPVTTTFDELADAYYTYPMWCTNSASDHGPAIAPASGR